MTGITEMKRLTELVRWLARAARDAAFHETLSQIAARKRALNTPARIVRELPRDIPLPAPLLLGRPPESPESKDTGPAKDAHTKPNADAAPAPGGSGSVGADAIQGGAVIPAEDLKPLFDFVQDCKACRAQLATREADLADEQAKNEALARERDAAVRAAKGGGFWRRVRHAAKWFAIGAVAGAAAGAASR